MYRYFVSYMVERSGQQSFENDFIDLRFESLTELEIKNVQADLSVRKRANKFVLLCIMRVNKEPIIRDGDILEPHEKALK